ncbi:hypothetical protein BKA83DRAFT_4312814 [Pisolithus microcarpus]|nr:hypothetical protein BKA83DRAFT_4396522 [Pisolithus microcarpus]KAI6018471.1 hypothetical protein BKA83DRAFT_4312814 [Pisolithus microcarpus]
MAPLARSPYTGKSRRLVIAFDIGTTYSGVSYSILTPGEIPDIFPVTRFPHQGHVGGNCKIPTVIYYDKQGKVCVTGIDDLGDFEPDEVENWTKVQWFKMHLRPKSSATSDAADQITPLPPNKTVIDIFVDFMEYLYDCTRKYIQQTFPNQPDFLVSMDRNNAIDFVLTHPNGWEGSQQAQMRQAAVRAKLVPDTDAGRARIRFVTEGEASLHLCIQRGLMTPEMERGEGVLIVDAGGGTIDVSAYSRNLAAKEKNTFEEIAAAQCFFQGSIYVTNRARCFIENRLNGSKFQHNIKYIVNAFDKQSKLTFRDRPLYVPANSQEKDAKLGMRIGSLRLEKEDVAGFFKPSIDCIVNAVKEQRRTAKKTISTVFLVGGFAASDWLYNQIEISMKSLGVKFFRPDSNVNKAVADGGVSYFIDHSVTARVSKYACGVRSNTVYDSNDQEHRQRSSQVFRSVDGYQRLRNSFDIILPKDTKVSETKEFRRSYNRTSTNRSDFGYLADPILCYKGSSPHPRWTDVDAGSYSTLCNVVDNGQLINTSRYVSNGGYYIVEYDVVLAFGLTELAAQYAWKENGVEKRCPAKITYDFQ